MKTIVWDCDDVLANMRDMICSTLAPHFGVTSNWRIWTSYNFGEAVAQKGAAAIFAGLITTKLLENLQPESYAQEILSEAKLLGYQNIILTSRGWHPAAEQVTTAWLQHHRLDRLIDKLIITPYPAEKYPYIDQLSDVRLFVEDSAAHCVLAKAYSAVSEIVLIRRPWNINHPGSQTVTQIDQLSDLSRLLVKHQ